MGTPREKGGTVPNFSRFPALPYRMALHSRGTQGRAGFSWGWVGVTEEEEKEGEERRGKKEGREDAGLGLGARPPACWGTSPIAPAAAGPSCGGSSPHRLTRLPALPFLSHTAGPGLCPELSLRPLTGPRCVFPALLPHSVLSLLCLVFVRLFFTLFPLPHPTSFLLLLSLCSPLCLSHSLRLLSSPFHTFSLRLIFSLSLFPHDSKSFALSRLVCLFPCLLLSFGTLPFSILIPGSPSPPRNYQLWLGRHSLFEVESTAQFVQVNESFPHPQFNLSLLKNHTTHPGEDYSYDLMLLRLKEPAQITDTVKVLDLPTQEPQLGSTCYASGWGSIEPDKRTAGPAGAAWSPDLGLRQGRGERMRGQAGSATAVSLPGP